MNLKEREANSETFIYCWLDSPPFTTAGFQLIISLCQNVNFVLLYTGIKQAPVLSSHFCASLVWLFNTGLSCCSLQNVSFAPNNNLSINVYSQIIINIVI